MTYDYEMFYPNIFKYASKNNKGEYFFHETFSYMFCDIHLMRI